MSEPSCCPLCGASLSPEQMECTACGETIPRPETTRRFRWRFVSTALLTIFGSLGIVSGVLSLLMVGVFVIIYPTKRILSVESLGMGAAGLCWGTLWLLAAHWCWQRRWVSCALAFAGGYVVMGIVGSIASALK